jgi:hypothetical protein
MDKASQTIMKYKSQLISNRTATHTHTIFACFFGSRMPFVLGPCAVLSDYKDDFWVPFGVYVGVSTALFILACLPVVLFEVRPLPRSPINCDT